MMEPEQPQNNCKSILNPKNEIGAAAVLFFSYCRYASARKLRSSSHCAHSKHAALLAPCLRAAAYRPLKKIKRQQPLIKYHFIVAMHAEANDIIQKFKLIKLKSYENIDVYFKQIRKKKIHLFVNHQNDSMDKIGTVHAALLTYKAIKFLKPDIIINMGTCGGIHAQSIKIFDIICSHNFIIYHDRYSGDDNKSITQSLGFLPCVDYSKKIKGIKHGVIASSNSLIVNKKNWEIIHKYKVKCVDMEAAACAEVANEFNIPFAAFKVVTDIVYEIDPVDALPQFKQNFHKSMKLLSSKVSNFFLTV